MSVHSLLCWYFFDKQPAELASDYTSVRALNPLHTDHGRPYLHHDQCRARLFYWLRSICRCGFALHSWASLNSYIRDDYLPGGEPLHVLIIKEWR